MSGPSTVRTPRGCIVIQPGEVKQVKCKTDRTFIENPMPASFGPTDRAGPTFMLK